MGPWTSVCGQFLEIMTSSSVRGSGGWICPAVRAGWVSCWELRPPAAIRWDQALAPPLCPVHPAWGQWWLAFCAFSLTLLNFDFAIWFLCPRKQPK